MMIEELNMEYSNKNPSHRLQRVYNQMLRRCYNIDDLSYKNYGARGIKVCDEWLNKPSLFYEWAYNTGYDDNAKKGEYTIDRKDVNGNYCPENCRWATAKEQARNRRNTYYMNYKGERKPVSEVAEIIGISYQALYDRLSRGLTDEEAVDNDYINSRKTGHAIKRNVILINKENGEVLRFNSCSEASRFLGFGSAYLCDRSKKLGNNVFEIANYHVELGEYNKQKSKL